MSDDRYVRGELNPAESRELAQKALGDPELFEELTSIALAKAAVSPGPNVVRFSRKARWFAGLAAIAAAVVVMLFLRTNHAPVPVQQALLASGLQSARDNAPIFRGGD